MNYKAVYPKKNVAVYLSRDSQMEEHLRNGANIYGEDEDGRESLIATPKDGFLVDRPIFPAVHSTRRMNNE